MNDLLEQKEQKDDADKSNILFKSKEKYTDDQS